MTFMEETKEVSVWRAGSRPEGCDVVRHLATNQAEFLAVLQLNNRNLMKFAEEFALDVLVSSGGLLVPLLHCESHRRTECFRARR